jgi:hypothetical protein
MDKNLIRIFVLVFGLIGLGLLTASFFSIKSEITFRTGAVSAPGKVVDLVPTMDSKRRTLYKPVFEFTDRNDRVHRITGSVASDPPSYERGETVTVRYKPENPEKAQLAGFMDTWLTALVCGGLGIVFTSIAAGFVIYAVRRRSIRAWLAVNGLRVQAQVESVYYDDSTEVNGRSPFRIAAQWQNPTDRKVYVFHSDSIWFDPKPFMQQDTVDVRVNADNPHQYEMDISFLPKAG